MYNEISANRRKTVLLLGGFLVLVIGLGWALSFYFNEPAILPIAVIWSIIQAGISYYFSDKIALAASGAKALTEHSEFGRRVHRAVENAAITAGLPKPRVYVITDAAMNAFATGRDPKNAAVAVTTGLVEQLDKRELEGVLAHEMSHIGNHDIKVMSIVVVLVGVVVLASDMALRMTYYMGGRDRDNQGNGIMALVALVFAILAPIFATLIQLAISRKREFLADATGALLTRDPEGLASALLKIGGDRDPLDRANNATAHMYIANPFKEDDHKVEGARTWFANLFNTHPPIPERVKRLRAMV